MHVLLTNDDGITAEPLWALYNTLTREHQVTVVAPDRERTAIGHAITLNVPLRYHTIMSNRGGQGIAVNGTPADCVKLALNELMPEQPDLVIAGINPGSNVGVNINYSGTIAAAKEAVLNGLPAIAVSIDSHQPVFLDENAEVASKLIGQLWECGLPEKTAISINLPDRLPQDTCGMQWCRQNNRVAIDGFQKQLDPRGRSYYWYALPEQPLDVGNDAKLPMEDTVMLKKGYITLTPIRCNLTDEAVLQQSDQSTLTSFWANYQTRGIC